MNTAPSIPPSLPTKLQFSIGSFGLGGVKEFNLEDGRIIYSLGFQKDAPNEPRVAVPTESQWCDFWKTMDEIGVWEWKAEYDQDNDIKIKDGTQWTLELQYGSKMVTCYGDNVYPGSRGSRIPRKGPFRDFLRAFSSLTGVKGIH